MDRPWADSGVHLGERGVVAVCYRGAFGFATGVVPKTGSDMALSLQSGSVWPE